MGDAGDHRGRARCAPLGAANLAAVALLAAVVPAAQAQDAPAGDHAGFIVRKQAQPITEAIEDFERYRDRKAWEKAFAALSKVADASGDRLVLGTDGLAVSTPVAVRRELLTLPPDGLQAYRLFNDAKARALFLQATAAHDGSADAAPVDEVGILRQLVDRYFITNVGDQAADRLGDALFEAGDFTGAEGCWRLILDSFPDTSIAPAQLQAKRAAALASAGQWEPFESVRAVVHDRYAGQQVHVGGRDVDAVGYVDGLATHGRSAAVASGGAKGDEPLVMPSSNAPAWQFPLMDADSAKKIEEGLAMYGWGRLAGQLTSAVPPVAVDGRRLYVDWFGACMAFDLATGKMVWRNGSTADIGQAIAAAPQQGTMIQADGFGVVAAGDRVLFVGAKPPAGQRNNNGMMIRRRGEASGSGEMACLSAETGKVLWTTANGPLANVSFVGQPLVSGAHLYAVGIDGGGNHNGGSAGPGGYVLVSVNLSDGAMQSRVALGTPQFPVDQFRGLPLARAPALCERAGKVYVLTNDGAVLAVDPAADHVDWAFTFAPKAEAQDNYYYNYAAPPDPNAPGALVAAGSTLYVKETGTSALYALDLDGPSLRWKRPVDEAAGLGRGARGRRGDGRPVGRRDGRRHARPAVERTGVGRDRRGPAAVGRGARLRVRRPRHPRRGPGRRQRRRARVPRGRPRVVRRGAPPGGEPADHRLQHGHHRLPAAAPVGSSAGRTLVSVALASLIPVRSDLEPA